MKKVFLIIFALMVLTGAMLFIRGEEDTWLCDQEAGKWVKHGAPKAPKPTEKCGEVIKLTTPLLDQVITSPLVIEGEARGTWFFEGDFPVVLTDWDGRIIAESFVTAQSEWMTEDFVRFTGASEFEKPEAIDGVVNRGSLILRKDNPSDLPEFDDALEISVRFD